MAEPITLPPYGRCSLRAEGKIFSTFARIWTSDCCPDRPLRGEHNPPPFLPRGGGRPSCCHGGSTSNSPDGARHGWELPPRDALAGIQLSGPAAAHPPSLSPCIPCFWSSSFSPWSSSSPWRPFHTPLPHRPVPGSGLLGLGMRGLQGAGQTSRPFGLTGRRSIGLSALEMASLPQRRRPPRLSGRPIRRAGT